MSRNAAEDRRYRGPVTVEGDLTGLHALVAQLRQVTGDGQARAVLDEDDRDPGVPWPRVWIGLAQQGDQLRSPGVGDPCLRAVDHQVAAVLAGSRGHGLEVGAAT